MADHTYTYFVFFDVVANTAFTGKRCNVRNILRKKQKARPASGLGLVGFTKRLSWGRALNLKKTTVPQFSGTVFPAKVRAVDLCAYPSNTVEPVVLEQMTTDLSGNFACEGWYAPLTNQEYFLRVSGDDTHSIKDFPLNSPVENEYKVTYGTNPADTAADLQALYVEDNFLDTQGLNLASHTPDTDTVGTGWTAPNIAVGNHAAASNFVAYVSSGTDQIAHIDANDPDVFMTCEFVLGSGTMGDRETGLVLRYVSADNYIRVVISNASTSRPRLSIISKVATVDTTIYSIDFPTGIGPYVLDRYYLLSLAMNGNRLIVDFDMYDWNYLSYMKKFQVHADVADHATATRHGFILGDTQAYADKFTIWSI